MITPQDCRRCGGRMAVGDAGFRTCPACPPAELPRTDVRACAGCDRPTTSKLDPPRCERCRDRRSQRCRVCRKRTTGAPDGTCGKCRWNAGRQVKRRRPPTPAAAYHRGPPPPPERIQMLTTLAALGLPLFPDRRSA